MRFKYMVVMVIARNTLFPAITWINKLWDIGAGTSGNSPDDYCRRAALRDDSGVAR